MPIGGCAAVDNSRNITLASDSPQAAQFTNLSSEARAQVEWVFFDNQPVVGFYSDPSCWLDPTHQSDFVAYYSNASNTGHSRSNISFSGDTATLNYENAALPGAAEGAERSISMVGTFSVSAAQAAIDEIYPHQKPKKQFYIEPAQRTRVPVQWSIEGNWEGVPFTAEFTAQSIVGLGN